MTACYGSERPDSVEEAVLMSVGTSDIEHQICRSCDLEIEEL